MDHKSGYLVILCCALIHMTTLGSDMIFYHMADQDATTIYLVSLVIAYLLYPLLGWMADVYFTRYSFVRASFISTIAAMGLLIMSGILFLTSPERLYFLLSGFSIIICLIGLGLFESTAIQFGMDQMLEASSEQLSTFIHWYYWSCYLGQLMILYLILGILAYFSDCSLRLEPTENLSRKLHSYEFVITCTILIACAVIQLLSACCGLGLLIGFKRHLNIDRTGDHPLKLIYQVLKYAWQHKVPEHRSAFTYWEEDIPPRIDLGKHKYGGPFTTEEVEDTKTFLRILILFLSLFGFHLSGHGYSLLDQLTHNQCPSNWVLLVVGEQLHTTALIVTIGVPFYRLLVRVCRKYLPNMLKQMGIGLFCCFVKTVTEIIIHSMLAGESRQCSHVDDINIDSCYFLKSQFLSTNGTCSNISQLTNHKFFCHETNNTLILLLIPNILQGLSVLLIFMTTLEFICAQAPLRLKGLLIGIWYASLGGGYVLQLVESAPIFTSKRVMWEIFHEVKAFLIFLSLMLFLCVSKWYRYRLRDEVVNEQFLVEEIYERELTLAEEYERENEAEVVSINECSGTYGTIS